MPPRPTLLAVPNISEGRDGDAIWAIGEAFTGAAAGVRLLDLHSDGDHHRSVFTLAGEPQALVDALLAGARETLPRVAVGDSARGDESRPGQHPHVGSLDVAPIVYLEERDRGVACASALVLAERLGGELSLPVFLYGELTASDGHPQRTRAELRRGGLAGLTERIGGEPPLRPDFGPPGPHPTAGVTLVAARPPLVAFNLQLAAPAGLAEARRVAALIREGGDHGLPGVRAIGIELRGGVGQVSMNVERPLELSLAAVASAVAEHAPLASAELVGLAPAAALAGFPADLWLHGFDPTGQIIENALGSL